MKFILNYTKTVAYSLRVLFLILLCMSTSCKKFLEVESPATKIDGQAVFQSDAAAISLMTGVYFRASFPLGGNFTSLSMYAGLSADELTAYGLGQDQVNQLYTNGLNSTYNFFWKEWYNYIYATNEVIEGIAGPNRLSEPVKKRLLGEAKLTRAYFYFYLVNLYGDVPLVVGTDYRANMLLYRSPVSKVYELITNDLKEAQTLLGDNYTQVDLTTASTDRVRPNKAAATALLARVYLFTGDYENAAKEASKVIAQTNLYTLGALNSVFLKDNKESIWQLQSTQFNMNTYEGDSFILIGAPSSSKPVSLSNYVYNAFEPGDGRKNAWVGSVTTAGSAGQTYYFPYKYKVRAISSAQIPITENEVLLRLAEQYLIRAEANIELNNISSGIDDLNTLRSRARAAATAEIPNPLPELSTALSKADALKAVEHERQVEMFAEMGDRWLTIKRMKGFNNPAISRANEIMPAITAAKGGTWSSNWQLYPIPTSEIQKDVNLLQNIGYN